MQQELLNACCVLSSIEEKLLNTSPNASVDLFNTDTIFTKATRWTKSHHKKAAL